MTAKKRSQLKVADQLFSRIVRAPGQCEQCGTTENLQCAHGFSRRYRAIRWDERNAWPLCRGCHLFMTMRPLEWDEWLHIKWGEPLYAEMRKLALTGRNPNLVEVVVSLRERWDQIEKRAA